MLEPRQVRQDLLAAGMIEELNKTLTRPLRLLSWGGDSTPSMSLLVAAARLRLTLFKSLRFGVGCAEIGRNEMECLRLVGHGPLSGFFFSSAFLMFFASGYLLVKFSIPAPGAPEYLTHSQLVFSMFDRYFHP